ncbi:unnamed protein product [Microthlaspi erraticum]|uniref:Uncharacterized protein n=1 Tax=Microthlaspi erraticum TaxID=1685480 RepID=A0A6D2HAQ2_9BRAS|nr:unnamed protein product [Microthlaspi erraticum]
MGMSKLQHRDSRWLLFPRIIYGVLQMQSPLSLLDDDVLVRPLHYQKDKRSGLEYIKRENEKKKKMKQGQSSTSQVRSTSAPATESTSEGFISVDLGSVRFPTPPLQPTAAIQVLQDIVYTLQPSQRRFRDFSRTYKVLVRHKAKKGEIEDATGLTHIVNQSGSASGRMDGHVAELSGA